MRRFRTDQSRFSTNLASTTLLIGFNPSPSERLLHGTDIHSKSLGNSSSYPWNTTPTVSSPPDGQWNTHADRLLIYGWNWPPEEVQNLIICHPVTETTTGNRSQDGRKTTNSILSTTPKSISPQSQWSSTRTPTNKSVRFKDVMAASSAQEAITSPSGLTSSQHGTVERPPQSSRVLEQLQHCPGPLLSPILLDGESDCEADSTLTSHQHLDDSLDYLGCLEPLLVSTPKKVGSLPFVACLDRPDEAVLSTEEEVEVHAPPKPPRLL